MGSQFNSFNPGNQFDIPVSKELMDSTLTVGKSDRAREASRKGRKGRKETLGTAAL